MNEINRKKRKIVNWKKIHYFFANGNFVCLHKVFRSFFFLFPFISWLFLASKKHSICVMNNVQVIGNSSSSSSPFHLPLVGGDGEKFPLFFLNVVVIILFRYIWHHVSSVALQFPFQTRSTLWQCGAKGDTDKKKPSRGRWRKSKAKESVIRSEDRCVNALIKSIRKNSSNPMEHTHTQTKNNIIR